MIDQIIDKHEVDNVYIFQSSQMYILYSPLDKILLELEKSAYDELKKNKNSQYWKKYLDSNGQLALFASSEPEISDYVTQQKYDGIVFLLTDKCNLKCKYCYASDSQNHSNFMEKSMWENIIDFASKNLKNGISEFSIAFHGYGECTTNINSIKQIVSYANYVFNKIGIKCTYQVTSNGTFGNDACEWMISNNFRFDLSLDGDISVNDKMRLSRSGKSLHHKIANNIIKIANSKCKERLTLRATVTNQTLADMDKSLLYFNELGVKYVHFEPITPRGNAKFISTENAVNIEEYVKKFSKCISLASDLGMQIYYGPINFGIAVRFCSSKNKLIIDFLGRVLGCLQAGPESGLDFFHYADIDSEKKSLSLMDGKLQKINSFSVFDDKACFNCLLKFHCSGDCKAHNIDIAHMPEFKSQKCLANEGLFAWILENMLNGRNVESVLDFKLEKLC